MDVLHHVDIGQIIDSRGVSTFEQKGDLVVVDGQPMVRLSHGVIVRANGWSGDPADARLRAAMKIEEMGRCLLAQAEKMRVSVGAASEAST